MHVLVCAGVSEYRRVGCKSKAKETGGWRKRNEGDCAEARDMDIAKEQWWLYQSS